jgi:hypothetical protein
VGGLQTKRILTFSWHVVSICLGHTHVFIIDLLLFLYSGKRVKLWKNKTNIQTLLKQKLPSSGMYDAV